jgi:ribose 5-phosphate isomerase B
MHMKKILIASDHGGFELKGKLMKWLEENMPDVDVEDHGAYRFDANDDYPKFAFPVAEAVVKSRGESIGILICRSGNGMAIAANKVKGIRAALCFTSEHARKAVEHDHANVVVLDADYLGNQEHEQIVWAFLNAEPEVSGRHQRRVEQISYYEGRN